MQAKHGALIDWLGDCIGLDPDAIGRDFAVRAIERRMQANGESDENAYLRYAQENDKERRTLIDLFVVPETWFFRDGEPFRRLQAHFYDHSRERGVYRCLSAPCSSGEEPFSMAIALTEAGANPDDFIIDAVDISEASIAKARRGAYRPNSFREPVPGLDRYFSEHAEGRAIRDELKRSVRFCAANILDDRFEPPSPRFDAIFCRNLLIYFNQSARERCIQRLLGWLDDDGILVVGGVETLQSITDAVMPEGPSSVYRKRSVSHVNENPPAASNPAPRARHAKPEKPIASQPRELLHTPDALQPIAENASASDAFAESLTHARKLADEGKLDEARHIAQSLLDSGQPDAEIFYLLGLIDQASRRIEQAETAYQKALFLDSGHQGALAQMTLLKRRKGDAQSAERFRRRLNRIEAVAAGSES